MTWLNIIGVDETGLAGLSEDQRQRLKSAKHIITADRWREELHQMGINEGVEIWPSPFREIYEKLEQWRGQPCVILATGDPLWYGAGSSIVNRFPVDETRIEPAPSGFQMAASRMGWPMARVTTLTLHGRPLELIRRAISPGARLLILADSAKTPKQVADQLMEMGLGSAVMTALAHIGGAHEKRIDGDAMTWAKTPPEIADFHVLAVACPDHIAGFLSALPGLPDDAYDHDGKLTKSDIRAITLARLQPVAGQLLWDLGCGSGAVGIEWIRAAAFARAIGVDSRKDRLEVAAANAKRLGTPEWQDVLGDNMSVLAELDDPDAVFIGGGLTSALVDKVMTRLRHGGRLVVNAVTLESEAILLAMRKAHGGRLVRIAVSHAEPVGTYQGWRSAMPVTQWVWIKETVSG
jgi:precorrin-6Y C5,15-methyltransferase (decarboxylating)